MAEAEVQHSKNSFNGLAWNARVSRSRRTALISAQAPGGYPPAPYAFLSRANIGAVDVVIVRFEWFPSRRAQAWPSGSSLRRLKRPERMLAGVGRTTRSSVCSGSVPSGERRTGANDWAVARPTRSCGAQMSSIERRCSNVVISTGSPVGLQACYIGSVAGRPANCLQCEGKSEKVWLTAARGSGLAMVRGDGEASAT